MERKQLVRQENGLKSWAGLVGENLPGTNFKRILQITNQEGQVPVVAICLPLCTDKYTNIKETFVYNLGQAIMVKIILKYPRDGFVLHVCTLLCCKMDRKPI